MSASHRKESALELRSGLPAGCIFSCLHRRKLVLNEVTYYIWSHSGCRVQVGTLGLMSRVSTAPRLFIEGSFSPFYSIQKIQQHTNRLHQHTRKYYQRTRTYYQHTRKYPDEPDMLPTYQKVLPIYQKVQKIQATYKT